MEPDFSGFATKANLKCSDGRTIGPDAFKHQDQQRVPLVWQHGHNDPSNVLGHVMLENKDGDVYCRGYFNDTATGQSTKLLVQHGDVDSLSIYANRLVEKSKTVMHGMIREVSLVIAGANPGARIDFVNIQHADGAIEEMDDEATITTGIVLEHGIKEEVVEPEAAEEPPVVEHAEDDKRTVEDIYNTLNQEQKDVVSYMIGVALSGDTSAAHADADTQNTLSTLNEEQKNVVYYLLGEALSHQADSEDDPKEEEPDAAAADVDNADAAHADNQEGNIMTNVFENGADKGAPQTPTLSHADQQAIFKRAAKLGSLKDAVEEFVDSSDTLAHGIQGIETLFPDARAVTSSPEWLKRRTEWVATVMDGTTHLPFSRIKSLTANLHFDEARAKGYIKGNLKKEEFFRVAKRVTEPQTVYKKQQLDRDDILDITDFDVVTWLKGEMRMMLEEEIARAVLVGDGRSGGDPDKINEERIRPIATDNDLFTTQFYINLGDAGSSAEEIIDTIVLQRRHYRGTGNPTLFCGETLLAQLLSIKDSLGRRIYSTINDLLSVLRVSNIVPVELMDSPSTDVLAVIVNLRDYSIGSDKGGDVSLFDDFDIDYNQYKYLIETRISGALTKAKSAMVIRKVASSATLVDPVAPSYNSGTHAVTVAATPTGITYKNKDTGGALSNGTPVVLTPGQELTVIAVPNSGYYLASNTADEFYFSYEAGRRGTSF